jgi:dolichol kinase
MTPVFDISIGKLGIEFIALPGIACVVSLGLWLSNYAYDRGVPHYLSRKIGHFAGGVGFLLGALFLPSAAWAMFLSAFFGTILLLFRFIKSDTFRGVGGNGRSMRIFSEVWFAWVAVPVIGVSWLWLKKPLIAAASLVFMAWGDGATGYVRSFVYGRPVKGFWGSAAMLCVCLTISLALIKPFWVGAVGAFIATCAEWAFGESGIVGWADDNWGVPLMSSGAIMGVLALTGNL